MFRFHYDAHANRITVYVGGFWTVSTVREFAAAAGAFAQETRAIRDDYDVLIDSREFPVQSNEVAELLPRISEAGLALTSGRVASVAASHLNKMQAERTHAHSRFAVFLTVDEAEAWLADKG
ncbi:MAG: hypothetical protein EOP62_16930 [Sphingomonadales bacterium]|nr:MAG: hypothetical protein EOP62_16930 [Sphingomonadales bacterium]